MRKNNILLGAALVGGFLLLRSKSAKAGDETKDKIKVGIFANRVMGESPLTINFKLDTQRINSLKLVKWMFGDGHTSNLVNPTHTFRTDKDTELFHVDVTAIDDNDNMGSGRLNITVIKSEGINEGINGDKDVKPLIREPFKPVAGISWSTPPTDEWGTKTVEIPPYFQTPAPIDEWGTKTVETPVKKVSQKYYPPTDEWGN